MFNGKGFVSFGNNIPDKDMSQKKKIIFKFVLYENRRLEK